MHRHGSEAAPSRSAGSGASPSASAPRESACHKPKSRPNHAPWTHYPGEELRSPPGVNELRQRESAVFRWLRAEITLGWGVGSKACSVTQRGSKRSIKGATRAEG